MNIRVIIRIYEMISMECTSKPSTLPAILEVSERKVYNCIAFMKEELKAPVNYYNLKECYYYKEPPGLCFAAQNTTS